MTTDDQIRSTTGTILEAQHMAIHAAAQAWLSLARAATGEELALDGIAAEAEASPGIGLLELADRVTENSVWSGDAGNLATLIAGQLTTAAEATSVALEEAIDINERHAEIRESAKDELADVDGMALVGATENIESRKQALLTEATTSLDTLDTAYAQVVGGEAPAAPAGGGGGGGGVGGGGGAMAGGAMAGGSMGAASFEAANGSMVGAGSYPHSRVLGPEHGDFAGWVQSPSTGYLVDPATGREFDQVSGRWIDPVTGRPFGEVTEYASRLSGLGAGPGAVAGLSGGAAAVGAGAGMAGMYGGVMPPSTSSGPARGQMMNTAARNLSHRAAVARGFAMHEGSQAGGRPFVPPPAGGHHGRGAGATSRTAAPSGRGAATAAGSGQGRAASGGSGIRGGTPVAQGARGFVPPPPAGQQGRAGGADRRQSPPTSGRSASGTRAMPPPPSPHQARAKGAVPARAAAAARHQLSGGTARSTAPAAEQKQPEGTRATQSVEDPGVWRTDRVAARGVLGD